MKGTREVSYVFRRSASLFEFKCFRFIPGGSGTYTKLPLELPFTHMVRQLVTNWCGRGIHFSSRVTYRLYLFTPQNKSLKFLSTDKITNPLRNLYVPQAKSIKVNGPLTWLVPFTRQAKSIRTEITQTHQIPGLLDFKTVAQDDGKVVNPSHRYPLPPRKYFCTYFRPNLEAIPWSVG